MENGDLKFLEGKRLDLFVESFSNAARTVQIRGISKGEQIIADHTTNADRSLASSAHRITDVPVFLTARLGATGVQRGACYVKVSLRVNQVVVALLFAGYVTDAGAPVFPGGKVESSIEGPGLIRSITGTDQAANTEISETVPTGARWKLLALLVSLVTDANVANRNVHLVISDGATRFLNRIQSASITASLTTEISWAISGLTAGISDTALQLSLPHELKLGAGFVIATATGNLQATDNYGAPQLLVEEWIEP